MRVASPAHRVAGYLRSLGLLVRGRTVLALLVAPLAAGAVNAAWIMAQLSQVTLERDAPNVWAQFVPGVMLGTLFELFILLPLLYVFERARYSSRVIFVLCGIAIWYLASLVAFSFTSLTWDERVLNSAMFLVLGVPLVVVFGLLVHSDVSKA